jgi:hypothetical protein
MFLVSYHAMRLILSSDVNRKRARSPRKRKRRQRNRQRRLQLRIGTAGFEPATGDGRLKRALSLSCQARPNVAAAAFKMSSESFGSSTARWAEPDVGHGAALMRHVFENRAEARARA